MNERLPIIIQISNEIITLTGERVYSAVNKLEAQLNFQTMMANWYGDETSEISITLLLHIPSEFEVLKEHHKNSVEVTVFSDDVFSLYGLLNSNDLLCHVMITNTELGLVLQQPKVLLPLLTAKLTKVLALIAEQFNYPALP